MASATGEETSKMAAADSNLPYELSTSDNLDTLLVSCLLNGNNYPTWQRAMSNALRVMDKYCFVDGSMPKPAATAKDSSSWQKCNAMVITWIFNALAPELHDSVAYFETAAEMWHDLEERFA
ncbi:hypothetical protein Dimus_038017 [Dionaea muscipula]